MKEATSVKNMGEISSPLNMKNDDDELSSVEIDSEWEDSLSTVSAKSLSKLFVCPVAGCTKYFSKQARLKTHSLCHTGERPFECQEEGCNASYTRTKHLQRHFESVHSKESFVCDQCHTKYKTSEHLKKHQRVVHAKPAARFDCDKCGKTFAKKNFLASHMAWHDDVLPHKCELCEKRFKFPNKLRRHMLKHEKKHSCEECGEEFENFHQLRTHKSKAHPQTLKCPTCSFRFTDKVRYKEHMKVHADQREVFHCPKVGCDLNFVKFSNLKNHVKIVHDGVRFNCNVEGCIRTFTSRRRLAIHVKNVHEEGKEAKNRNNKINSKMTSASRKDKGTHKKSIATFLSCVDIGIEGEKVLLNDTELPLDVKQVEKELEEIIEDVSSAGEEQEEESVTEICRRDACNVKRKLMGVINNLKKNVNEK